MHELPNDQANPKVVGSQHLLQQLTQLNAQKMIDNIQHADTSRICLERNGTAEIVTNRHNESENNGKDKINDKQQKLQTVETNRSQETQHVRTADKSSDNPKDPGIGKNNIATTDGVTTTVTNKNTIDWV